MNSKTQNSQRKEITNEAIMNQTMADMKNSAIFVSVLVNLFVLTTWLVIAISEQHSAQVVSLLQN